MMKILPGDLEEPSWGGRRATSTSIQDATVVETPLITFIAIDCIVGIYLLYEIFSIVCAQDARPRIAYACFAIKSALFVLGCGMFCVKSSPRLKTIPWLQPAILEQVFAVIMCIAAGTVLTLRQTIGQCGAADHQSGLHYYAQYCNPIYDQQFLPAGYMMLLIQLPLAWEMVLPSMRWYTTCLCFLISFGFLIGNILAFRANHSLISVMWAMLVELLALVGRRYNMKVLKRQLCQLVQDSSSCCLIKKGTGQAIWIDMAWPAMGASGGTS